MLSPDRWFLVTADLVREKSLVADICAGAEDRSLAHNDVPEGLVEEAQEVSTLADHPLMKLLGLSHERISEAYPEFEGSLEDGTFGGHELSIRTHSDSIGYYSGVSVLKARIHL